MRHINWTDYYNSSLRAMTQQEKLDSWFKNRENEMNCNTEYIKFSEGWADMRGVFGSTTQEKKEMNEYTKKIEDCYIIVKNENDFKVIRNIFKKLDIPFVESAKYLKNFGKNTPQHWSYSPSRKAFVYDWGYDYDTTAHKKLNISSMFYKLFEDDKVKMTIGEKEFYISKESAEAIKEGLK